MTALTRLVLALAAVDSLAMGLWAVARPNDLFTLLQLHPPADAFLWPTLGVLSVANGFCLTAAAVWPTAYRELALVAWVGRLLSCGMWLWLLGTSRIAPAPTPLEWLLAHDAFWLVALSGILLVPFVSRGR